MIRRPIDNADPELDADKPQAPRFVRRIADALSGSTAMPDLRQAEEAARVAKQREAEAREAAAIATAERQRAEKALPAARARSQREAEVLKQKHLGWISDIERQIKQAEAVPDAGVSIPLRGLARTALHGDVSEDGRRGEHLLAVVQRDSMAGRWYGISQAASLWINRAIEDAADAGTTQMLDRLECQAWRELVARLHVIAGEE